MLFGFEAMRPARPGSRAFLYAAGGFNLAAALLLVVLARLAPHALGVEPLAASQLLYVDLFALLVAGFGAGYVLGGRDLPRFWPFVAMGAACKVGVAVLAFVYFASRQTGPLVMLLATGDAVFAVLFVRLLRTHAAA